MLLSPIAGIGDIMLVCVSFEDASDLALACVVEEDVVTETVDKMVVELGIVLVGVVDVGEICAICCFILFKAASMLFAAEFCATDDWL